MRAVGAAALLDGAVHLDVSHGESLDVEILDLFIGAGLGVSFGQCWFVARVKGHTDRTGGRGFPRKPWSGAGGKGAGLGRAAWIRRGSRVAHKAVVYHGS